MTETMLKIHVNNTQKSSLQSTLNPHVLGDISDSILRLRYIASIAMNSLMDMNHAESAGDTVGSNHFHQSFLISASIDEVAERLRVHNIPVSTNLEDGALLVTEKPHDLTPVVKSRKFNF